MDTLSHEAIASLKTVLDGLLSSVVNPDVQRQLTVLPVHLHPIGLGGGLSLHPDPLGVVEGRRLEAIALIYLQSQNVISLNEIASLISTQLIAQRHSDLMSQGILSIKLESQGALLPMHHSDSDAVRYKELTFRVVYEFRKLPIDSEGIIQTVPIQVTVG